MGSPREPVSGLNARSTPYKACLHLADENGFVFDVTLIFTVDKAEGTFGEPAEIDTTYELGLTLYKLKLAQGYTWVAPETGLSADDGQSFEATYTDAGGNYETAVGNITVNVAKAAVSLPDIGGVTPPAAGAVPAGAVTETEQYTGTVVWSGAPAVFGYATVYTATVTLTPKADYTLTGVAADFFTVQGASAANSADSGVITAIFPATAADPSGGENSGVRIPESNSATVTVSPQGASGGADATSVLRRRAKNERGAFQIAECGFDLLYDGEIYQSAAGNGQAANDHSG
jgi:hypothetical protein